VSIVDGKALAQYCRAEAMGEKYYRDALKEPYAFNAKGEMKLSPAAMGWATCTKISKAFLIEFGLTPASRSKLKVEKKESELPDVELAPVPTSIEEIELPDETVVQ
jgi:P27 family predicted phage terminase small subunit